MEEKSKDLKCIKSAKLAKVLINKGFIVKDIKPNNENKTASVFIFEKSPELMAIVKDWFDREEEEKFIKAWKGTKSF